MQDNLDKELGNEQTWNEIHCAMRRDMHYIDLGPHRTQTACDQQNSCYIPGT